MMARVCVRPGCDRDAVARLTYDTIACQVWLDPVPELPGRAQEICELHASRLTVPRGWMLCDRRPEEPALFVHEAVAVNGEPVGPAPAASRTAPLVTLRQADAAPEPTPAPEPARTEPVRELERTSSPEPEPVRDPEPEPRRTELPPVARLHPAARPMPLEEPVEPVRPARRRVARTVRLPVSELHRGEPDREALPQEDPDQAAPAEEEPAAEELAEGDLAEGAALEELEDEAPAEDLPESLQATSPLLARAFRVSAPQGSVLSRALLNEPD